MQLCRHCNSLEDMETKVLRVQRLALCVRYVSYAQSTLDRRFLVQGSPGDPAPRPVNEAELEPPDAPQPRPDAAACWRAWISMYTLISETAAGVTPGIRLACPKVRGRTCVSFSFISRDSPLTRP